ncbi:MAG: TetR family transcriptional regulator [Bacteroidetes bacterium]|jgi:AcrR family transcriptional regulator|nr:TetR family transcriptional regulator [Bacteroidota bacterium]
MNNKPNLSKSVILKTSAQLFRQESFAQVSMRDIANALNVKAASLYNHISSKDEILEAIIFSLVDEFMQSIENTKNAKISTKQKLEDIIKTHIDIAVKNPNSFGTLNNDWKFLKGSKKSEFINSRLSYERDLEHILKEGIKNHDIQNHNTKIIIYQILSPLRNIHLWNEKHQLSPQELKIELSALILGGILN